MRRQDEDAYWDHDPTAAIPIHVSKMHLAALLDGRVVSDAEWAATTMAHVLHREAQSLDIIFSATYDGLLDFYPLSAECREHEEQQRREIQAELAVPQWMVW